MACLREGVYLLVPESFCRNLIAQVARPASPHVGSMSPLKSKFLTPVCLSRLQIHCLLNTNKKVSKIIQGPRVLDRWQIGYLLL